MKFKKNADGTDMLDANGNPIPEVNTDVTVEEAARLKQVNDALVEELKQERKKKQELAEELARKNNPPAPAPEPSQIEKEVEAVLAKKEASKAQANKSAAFEKFISLNKEFHPENDPTGLKRQALETKFNRFNLQGVIEERDFFDAIKDAHRLLGGTDTPPVISKEIPNPYSTTPTPTPTPTPAPDGDLTPKEKKLMEKSGWTKEKLLKLKADKPDYLESLLVHIRD